VTVAVDGPLLPTPSWKVAIEVENPAVLEASIEQAASAAGVQLAHQQGERIDLLDPHLFEDRLPGQLRLHRWLPADRAVPSSADGGDADPLTGLDSRRSAAFRAQLPQDGHANFFGAALLQHRRAARPDCRSTEIERPDDAGIKQKSIAALTAIASPASSAPTASRSASSSPAAADFFGLGLDTLVELNSKGVAALPQLLPPILSIHASSH